MPSPTENDDTAWSFRAKVGFGVFAIIAAYFVIAEHRAHLLPYLPLLLLAVCPLMHIFMHHGHGGHGGNSGRGGRNLPDENGKSPARDPKVRGIVLPHRNRTDGDSTDHDHE